MDVDHILGLLEEYLPRSVVAVLAFGFNVLSSLVPEDQSTLQSWLPLVISLCAIYWTISSALRTASFAFRSIVFILKYGAVFAIASTLWTFVQDPANVPAAFSGIFGNSQTRTPRKGTHPPRKPSAWKNFEKQGQWRAQYKAHKKYEANVDEGRQVVEGIMETVFKAVGRFATERTFSSLLGVSSDQQDSQAKQDKKTKGSRSR